MQDNATAIASAFQPSDQDVRYVIQKDLDETLFVAASAGTGKTHSLVGRIVNLITTGTTTLDRIAAITFTEAAAAELRDKIRQQLENAAEDQRSGEVQRDRCRQGVSDIDQAAIRTLHSFAALLLHERPLEAGLPPAFETTDSIAAGIKFNEAWTAWLDEQLEEDSNLAPHLRVAFTLGLTITHLRQAALEFHENYADLEGVTFGEAAITEGSSVPSLADAAAELERLCQYSKLGGTDRLYDHVQGKLVSLRRLAYSGLERADALRLVRRALPLKFSRGRQSDWEVDPETGENACAAIKEILANLHDKVAQDLENSRRAVLGPILSGLQKFALAYARQRRAEGRAEFNDLLVWARELLRDNLEVRDHFRRRFSHLLIDEAQDTDPIQAEIAMFLAEGVPAGSENGARPTEWTGVRPEKGKLFVVGDQKQSIYRFRRADVAQMNLLKQLMEDGGGRSVSLVQNFRSHQAIIDWVNRVFAEWMGKEEDRTAESYIQASYEEMAPKWLAQPGNSTGPSVWALADEASKGTADEIRQQESADIASLLHEIVAKGWQVLDREATENTGKETYRCATYSDICILMPTRTGLRLLERELERGNVPYRLESASLIFDTQEIRDLLNCLRAIDNPADQVATVAALRSVAFGCSDVDLLQHHEAGGSFDYLRNANRETEGPVSESLEVLRAFHETRIWEPVGTLIDRFVRNRQLMESSVGHPRMREQWRRYRFIIEQAWQFAAAGGNSLRSFVNWVEDQIGQNARVTEAPVPESDEEAVRVMTVHASKGLEFPVVVLTGLNAERRFRANAVLTDRGQKRVEVGMGTPNGFFDTAGYAELAEYEKNMSEAEHVRLMYVATTRARDHLVLSLRRSERQDKSTTASVISAIMAEASGLSRTISVGAHPLTDEFASEQVESARETNAEEDSLEWSNQWEAERQKLLEERSLPPSTAATSLGYKSGDGREDKPEQDTPEPWRRGRSGTSVGRAVHAVLQVIDLASGDGIADRAKAQAMAEGVHDREEDIVRLSQAALESDVVKRAIASGRFWREVPVAASVGGGSLHGFIDLLFEEDDGLVVVDYKTDSLSSGQAGEANARYRLQGGAYAHAIQQVTGKRVKEVVFLYLQPKSEEKLSDLEMAILDANREAESRLQNR